jgi:hypothetical protein
VQSRARVERLRQILGELEQGAPSAERDALLCQIRARIADLEVGVRKSGAWSNHRPEDPLLADLAPPRTLRSQALGRLGMGRLRAPRHIHKVCAIAAPQTWTECGQHLLRTSNAREAGGRSKFQCEEGA